MCYPCHRTLPQLPQFSILMNLYIVYVINIRFIFDGEIYLLTYLLTYSLTYLLTYWKSAILGLSVLDPKNLWLPNQFSKVSCQYILNLMSKRKSGSFSDWINAYFQSFICLPPHNMNIFWPVHLFRNFLGVSKQDSANLGITYKKHYEAMKTFFHWQI